MEIESSPRMPSSKTSYLSGSGLGSGSCSFNSSGRGVSLAPPEITFAKVCHHGGFSTTIVLYALAKRHTNRKTITATAIPDQKTIRFLRDCGGLSMAET